ncbi:MAG: Uma2 family endonuclease [Bryobacteraceae bacterium]
MAAAQITAAEFLTLPQEQTQRTELVAGEIVPMAGARFLHENVKSLVTRELMRYLLSHPIGRIYEETMYRLTPVDARQPDVSFLLQHRVNAVDPQDWPQGAPDLAVEVVSSESAADLEAKIELYLANGAKYVITAFPERRVIHVYTPGGSSRLLGVDADLELPELLPGFKTKVSNFFE